MARLSLLFLRENKSAPTIPKPTAPVIEPTPTIAMYSPLAENDHPTSTHIYEPKTTPIAEHSKEVALAKDNDKDYTRLSEIKEKSESEEKYKKRVGKTITVKDTIVATEFMAKVDPKKQHTMPRLMMRPVLL